MMKREGRAKHGLPVPLIVEPVCSEFMHAVAADVPGKHENNGVCYGSESNIL